MLYFVKQYSWRKILISKTLPKFALLTFIILLISPCFAGIIPESGTVNGVVKSLLRAKIDNSLGEILLNTGDDNYLTFWVKDGSLFEGGYSFASMNIRDKVVVDYDTGQGKRIVKSIKLLGKTEYSFPDVTQELKDYQESAAQHPTIIIQKGKISQMASMQINSPGWNSTGPLGNFSLDLADGDGIEIIAPIDTTVEGLKNSYKDLGVGDEVSVSYILVNHHNYSQRIKVLSKNTATIIHL